MNNNLNLKDILQDCNINFLLGSGLSTPYLSTLGNIESLLTELETNNIDTKTKHKILICLYKKYFDSVICKNINILNSDMDDEGKNILDNYISFLKTINSILLQRKSTILNKQVNLFTTNIDVFLEKALDSTMIEYNDGFSGRFKPYFDLSNFKKSYFKNSLHYDNTSELPVFNLLKIHGSLTWHEQPEEKQIMFSPNLQTVKEINEIQKEHPDNQYINIKIDKNTTINTLCKQVKTVDNVDDDQHSKDFLKTYNNLSIVNPTKEKSKHTLLNQTYYEMLRIYANELEKENTVLFAMGFSFADEHIRSITLRAANSNPTLVIYVFAYSNNAKKEIEGKFPPKSMAYNNIKFIGPPQTQNEPKKDTFNYDLQKITQEFESVLPLLKIVGNIKS